MLTELSVAVVIVFSCLLFHVAGVLSLAEWLLRRRNHFGRNGTRMGYGVLMISLFFVILMLHVAEASLWAGFYYTRGLFSDFETSVYFSLGSYTTIGYGDVVLPQNWRLLGAIEGISGVLLCGVSTAFIFAVMNAMLQIRLSQSGRSATRFL
ncbi:MAG TPA: potassium channel family protein [Pyrinomonadaceae bacterium]